jgi:hypothetical protein
MATSRSHDGKKELAAREEEDASCRVKNVVPTSTVFAAALERLNRQSVIHLLQQIIQEVDQHCQIYGREKTEELNRLRVEVMALLAVLQKGTEEQRGELTILDQRISELTVQLRQHTSSFEPSVTSLVSNQLQLSLPTVISSVTANVTSQIEKTVNGLVDARTSGGDLKALRDKIEQLSTRLEKLKQGSSELSSQELKQVEALVLKLIASYDFSEVFAALKITVNGRSFPLERLIEVLATVDKVVDTHIDYSDTDLTGARMVLTDRTQVAFVCVRREQQGGRQIHYVFQTPDWKGVPASFTLIFERRDTQMQMCGRTVVLTSYDGVFQSNIKFDLCQQAGGRVL